MYSKNKILIPVLKTKCNAATSFHIFNLHLPDYDAITHTKIKCIVSEHCTGGLVIIVKLKGNALVTCTYHFNTA